MLLIIDKPSKTTRLLICLFDISRILVWKKMISEFIHLLKHSWMIMFQFFYIECVLTNLCTRMRNKSNVYAWLFRIKIWINCMLNGYDILSPTWSKYKWPLSTFTEGVQLALFYQVLKSRSNPNESCYSMQMLLSFHLVMNAFWVSVCSAAP